MPSSKLSLLYILSLIAVGALVVLTVFRPMTTSGKSSEVQRESLMKTQDGWIVQFDIINREGKEQNYSINFLLDEKRPYEEKIVLPDGKIYTFVRRINKTETDSGRAQATFAIYREGEAVPLEKIVYYLE